MKKIISKVPSFIGRTVLKCICNKVVIWIISVSLNQKVIEKTPVVNIKNNIEHSKVINVQNYILNININNTYLHK